MCSCDANLDFTHNYALAADHAHPPMEEYFLKNVCGLGQTILTGNFIGIT